MKFLRKPPLFTVRKRFAWWPHYLFEIRAKYFATGAEKVFYEPGWHHNINSPQGFTGAFPMTASGRRHTAPARSANMGKVTPVTLAPVNWFDSWIWLEHYLVCYDSSNNYPGAPRNSRWRHFSLPEQWNVWHEYD